LRCGRLVVGLEPLEWRLHGHGRDDSGFAGRRLPRLGTRSSRRGQRVDLPHARLDADGCNNR
jgi:hypothetical protein